MTQPQYFCNRFSVGLTGGIASGKSAAATRFGELGAAIVDTDVIAHALTAPAGAAMPAISQAFGTPFINADGSLNRAKMREHVFAAPTERLKLEAILHPLIATHTKALGNTVAGAYVVFVVPLLVDVRGSAAVWQQRVNRIAVVDCAEHSQLARLAARSNIDTAQGQRILAAQASRQARLAVANDVLLNNSTLSALTAQVDALHQQYVAMAAQHRG